MARTLVAAMILLAVAAPTRADDPLKERKKAWQGELDAVPEFVFHKEWANPLQSLIGHGADCEIRITREPKQPVQELGNLLTFEFVRDGKVILTLRGSIWTVFRAVKDRVYFAIYHPATMGGDIAAYDLTTGKRLWQTRLEAAGYIQHSAYMNLINMSMSERPNEDPVVWITGQETYGDYMEVLDAKTGTRLAHRLFRQGWESAPKSGAKK